MYAGVRFVSCLNRANILLDHILPTANLGVEQLLISRMLSSAQSSTSQDGEVILERIGNKGIITLNRPKQLNAINFEMAKAIYPQLKAWDQDNQIKMVIIKGTGDKAFCAGGDVKRIISEGRDSNLGKDFFRTEYTINNLIGSLSIPYLAIIDGICMGGGVGLSIHGNFRVATERAVFAMPETAIGFMPDVGASHFLPRLPGSLGLYFGLTGNRMSGRDLFKAGIATHFVPSDKLETLNEEIMRLDSPDVAAIDRILSKYQEQWEIDYRKEFTLKPNIGRINGIFGQAKSVEEIFDGLRRDNSEWSKKQLETLNKMSPTSLKLTFEQLKRGKLLTLPECLKMEYRMSIRLLAGHDFFEGVRAVLVDKDQKPNWRPSTIEEVKDEDIEAYFQPLPHGQELSI